MADSLPITRIAAALSWKPWCSTALLSIVLLSSTVSAEDVAPPKLRHRWKRNGLATAKYEILGAASRSNPLRQPLERPFAGRELFFRYRIRYDAKTLDAPPAGDGEFVVFWLDDQEGGELSTHSGGVPNAGIHVAKDGNRFMVRYDPGSQKFATRLVGDRDFLVIGRLWKSTPGQQEPFDRLELWVDPTGPAGATVAERSGALNRNQPHATTASAKAISRVAWIGFSTGVKTETEDRVTVWDIDVAASWHEILGLPKPQVKQVVHTVDFKQDVYPILKEHCLSCHGGRDAEEGIRLDVLDEVLNRTTPRNANASQLYRLTSAGKMPPGEDRLSDKQLTVLRAWIDEGLDWDEELLPTPIPQSAHWSFQRVRRPAIPAVRNKSWIRTPVDAFIARRHEELGVRPTPPTDKRTLNRRLSLDLLGLPPEFAGDDPSANVERLLAHPAYGERWGRHWLDVARWAESNGHQHNRDRKHAWRYRDWVVDAFKSNKPYDEFVREQIAGDEMTPVSEANLVATGFLAAATYSGNELDKDIQRNDILTDVANATAAAFLGLTMECAQCHTHKFDPISIRDYYRFQAFFDKGQPANVLLRPESTDVKSIIEERWRLFDSSRAKLIAAKRRQGIANPVVIPKTVLAAIKGEQRKRFDQLEKLIRGLPQSWAWQSATSIHPDSVAPHDMRFPLPRDASLLASRETFLLIRGDVKSPGPAVKAGWPVVFGATGQGTAQDHPTSADEEPDEVPRADRPLRNKNRPRMVLGDWLTSRENPLTARVWVNRVWQWHFGRGLVDTSSDFGLQGAPPSHPELLDYLASELIESGWNTNHIHSLIVNSATYRQSSEHSQHNAAIDPDNESYWRWTPRRLEAEAIRDTVLAVSGQLDTTRGGPSVAGDSQRRSLYLKQRRNQLPHQQRLFDGVTGNASCSRRGVSTTSLQPLWMLNSKFMQQAARDFAARAKSVARAFELAMNRSPSEEELALLRGLEHDHGLASACLAILNSSEFIYLK